MAKRRWGEESPRNRKQRVRQGQRNRKAERRRNAHVPGFSSFTAVDRGLIWGTLCTMIALSALMLRLLPPENLHFLVVAAAAVSVSACAIVAAVTTHGRPALVPVPVRSDDGQDG